MSRNRFLDHWDADLRGLTDEGVRERLLLASASVEQSLARGSGRNHKAARMWREKFRAAEAELERRGLSSEP